MEVRCDSAQSAGKEYRTLYTFEVYIRADECGEPNDFTFTFGAPVLYAANYTSYTEVPGVTADDEMGLVFGWLKDCQGEKLKNGTGGISMPHDVLYYLPSGQPDLDDPHTLAPGFFAAANALPIRGMASAVVVHQGSPLSLRSREFRVFPNKGSLVIFDRPKKPLP
jgi:hypothetical protein